MEKRGSYREIAFMRVGLIFLLVLVGSPIAEALGPTGDVYLGYSRLGANAFYPNVAGLNGIEGSASLKVFPFVSAEADVAHYGYGASSTISTTTFLAGPRVSVGAVGINIFAHALIGGEHSANSGGVHIDESRFTYALGGGLDVPIVPFLAWRVNGDYVTAPALTTQNATRARFSTGLVFRF